MKLQIERLYHHTQSPFLIDLVSDSFANHLVCKSDVAAASATASAAASVFTTAFVVVTTMAAAEAAAEAAATSELQMR